MALIDPAPSPALVDSAGPASTGAPLPVEGKGAFVIGVPGAGPVPEPGDVDPPPPPDPPEVEEPVDDPVDEDAVEEPVDVELVVNDVDPEVVLPEEVAAPLVPEVPEVVDVLMEVDVGLVAEAVLALGDLAALTSMAMLAGC
jgi:hypothetical protein